MLTAPRGGLLTFGAVLALYFSSSAIEALRTGLNRAYACQETRPWWLLRLQSLAFALVASAALLALAFLVVLGPLIWAGVLPFAPALAPLQVAVTFARLGVTTLLLAITLLIAHRWLPAKHLRLVDIAPGVVATFVSSIAFGEIFGVYLSEFARNYVSTYAGLASVMIALVFLYAMATLFVFGGALNAAIMRAREARRPTCTCSERGGRVSGPRTRRRVPGRRGPPRGASRRRRARAAEDRRPRRSHAHKRGNERSASSGQGEILRRRRSRR